MAIAIADKIIVEFVEEVCGLYFRSIVLQDVGDWVRQHVHDYDHATLIGSGAVELQANGRSMGEYRAGSAVEIKAGVEHHFIALEPMTRITCVHDVRSADSLKAQGF